MSFRLADSIAILRILIRSAVWSLVIALPAVAGVLVVAPHPDDDVIMASGVIRKAVGYDEVNVLFMTNGDASSLSTGLNRQIEAVAAQTQFLGMSEDNLIFLGYPDNQLRRLLLSYPNANQQYFTSYGQGTTYGSRGLGRMDYHRFRFGAPATYNGANLLTDLRTVLDTYRPEHIFTTSEFDLHTDHAYTYHAVKQALAAIRLTDPSYTPVLHSTIIWTSNSDAWPASSDPRLLHATMPGLAATNLAWAERESLNVPPSMQDWNLVANPKYRAIYAHASQTDQTGFITRWARQDEIFWAESPGSVNRPPVAEAGTDLRLSPGTTAELNGNASRDPDGDSLTYNWRQVLGPPVALSSVTVASPMFDVPANQTGDVVWAFELRVNDGALTSAADLVRISSIATTRDITGLATVTASSEAAGAEQFARKAVDGLVGGHPFDYRLEWASNRQKAGAWLRLTWSQPMSVDRVLLFDRPGANDHMTGATLSFSDGSSMSVSALQNDGAVGTLVSFPPRVTTSITVTATATSSSTKSVGLAEIVAYGTEAVPMPPAGPVNLGVTPTSHSQISLAWTNVASNGQGVRVERSLDGVSFSPIAYLGASVAGHSDTGLEAATQYHYRVVAFNGVGDSTYSNIASASTLAAPTLPMSPVGLTVVPVSPTQLNLGWQDTSSNEVGFRVERSIDGVAFAGIATVTANTTTYTDAGLPPSSTYYYRVVAFNSVGDSVAPGVTAATTPAAPTLPIAPSALAVASASSSQLNLSWVDNATDETGYRVERSADGAAFSVIANLAANSTAYSNTGLTASTRYYYRVVAFNSVGSSGFSNTASATTSGPVSPPPGSNVATSSAATASSQRPNSGQLAIKAIDGVIAGYPTDSTREWATAQERVGAWIRLNWATPQSVNRVVLYDRPNMDDWVTGAVLTFSDGSTVPVGALNNNGSALEVAFPARQTSSITFTVTAVGPKTYNIGLAEFAVFGAP